MARNSAAKLHHRSGRSGHVALPEIEDVFHVGLVAMHHQREDDCH